MSRLKNTAIWMGLILLYACGSSVAPETEVTQSAPIMQVQDTNQITQNTQVIWNYGNHSILTTIYDDPATDKYGDVICQTVISSAANSNGGNSSSVSCVVMKGDTK